MTETFLIDTNIWIGHSMAYPDAVNYINNELIGNGKIIAINTVIQMELLSHLDIEKQEIRAVFEHYIYSMADEIHDIDQHIAKKAGQIRRVAKVAGRKVPKGPDAIIAATASVLNVPLVSNNDKDFTWVSQQPEFGLKYINPIRDKEHYKSFQEAFMEDKRRISDT